MIVGFYLNFNIHSLRNDEKYFSYLFTFTKKFIDFLKGKELLFNNRFRIIVFNPLTQKYYGGQGQTFKWTIFNTKFDTYFTQFKRKKACLQILSVMKMNDPKDGSEIPVNFEIFLNIRNHRVLVPQLGHWSFEISGESEFFPESNSDWDFNDFFSNSPSNKKNIKLFNSFKLFFEQENFRHKRIKRINAGDSSLPWKKLHNTIYAYRDSLETLQKDLFADFELIRKEIEDKSFIIENERKKELNTIWRENLFSKVKSDYLFEAITYLNRTNHFIEEYFISENVSHHGSFRLFNEKEYKPLYPVIEKFYSYLTETIDEITTWPKILREFVKKWNSKYPSIRDKKIY